MPLVAILFHGGVRGISPVVEGRDAWRRGRGGAIAKARQGRRAEAGRSRQDGGAGRAPMRTGAAEPRKRQPARRAGTTIIVGTYATGQTGRRSEYCGP